MNVFVVPSWYPSPANPIAGIFHREHALAIGAMRPEWQVGIAVWGQGDTVLRLRQPWRWPGVLARSSERGRRPLAPNVAEYRNGALAWSDRFRSGRIGAVLAAVRGSLLDFERDRGRADVIHAWASYPAGWLAMKLSDETGIPYVISEPMGGPFPFPAYLNADGSLKSTLSVPLARAGARLSVSPTQKARMEELGVEDIDVVPLLADEELLAPGGEVDPRSFFTVALLIPDKGIGDLIDAAALLERDDVTFRIRGDGDRRPWRERAERLGVAERIVFLDRLSPHELRDEYRRCAAFVLPSHHEAGATSCIEALACGRPVVSTRCGAPEFIVTPEVGLLVAPRAPAELAEALRTVIEHGDDFDPEAIRASFMARFSRPVVVDGFERAYRKALASATAGP